MSRFFKDSNPSNGFSWKSLPKIFKNSVKIPNSVKNRWEQELKEVKPDDFGPGISSISNEGIEKINVMLLNGYTARAIAEETGHAKSTILRYRASLLRQGKKIKGLCAPYERQDIPYEMETEIPLLTWRWGVYSLDEQVGECERERYNYFHSSCDSPAEELIKREREDESEDFFKWFRAWVRGLPEEEREVAEEIMSYEEPDDLGLMQLKAHAMKIFA